jgi:hypothetical protein
MNRREHLIFLTAAATLQACATSGSVTDGSKLESNQGLLVFHIESDRSVNLTYDNFDPSRASSTFRSTMFGRLGTKGTFEIKSGTTTFVIPADPGDYMWTRLQSGNLVAHLNSSNRFLVKSKTITYIGHLRLASTTNRVLMTADDKETDIREHLSVNFPTYLKTLSFEKAIADFRLTTTAPQ